MSLIDKLDKINIYASSTLSIDDYASLSLLYQPLIGSQALGIYQMLYALIDRQSLNADILIYQNILDLFSIKNQVFEEARLRLEGIGLIETFKKKDVFVFLIKPPLTPAKFLQDTVFGAYLINAVGEDLFNMLVSRFKIEKFDRLGYDNITASFDDVYESVENDVPNINGFILGRKNNRSVEIENHNFDFDEFLSNIDEGFLENGMTPVIKRAILKISYVYGYNEDEMAMLYRQSIDKNQHFDLKILNRKANLLHKHNTIAQSKPTLKNSINEDEARLMNAIAHANMREILDQFWPGYPETYLKTISSVYDEIPLEIGVLNILIFGVLKKKDGELPPLQYFKKCGDTWVENGIVTKEDAWAYVRGLRSEEKEAPKKNNTSNTKVKKNEYTDAYAKRMKEEVEEL